MNRTIRYAACLVAAAAMLAACGTGGGTSSKGADSARGPIKIWYSNNAVEITWAKQMIKAWNAKHPKEKVTGQEIPAAKSSEDAVKAAITAGSTPCLVYNTAQIATPDYQQMGGLVPLDKFSGARQYIEQRSGTAIAKQYRSPDGSYYQIPWKSNPVMLLYNKKAFKKAGLDPNNPPVHTYAEFLATAKKLVAKGGVKYAITLPPTSEFFQSFFDFYPLFSAESGGTQLLENGKAQFDTPTGLRVARFLRSLYVNKLTPTETFGTEDPFATGKTAMNMVGPWAIAAYKGKVDWGVTNIPTSTGKPADATWSFTDAKTIAIYSSCKNRATAWDLLKFSTSEEQDGKLLTMTGEMPLRNNLPQTYPDYFAKNPDYKVFAAQAAHVVEVPYVSNSIEIWQDFRNAYSASVIFGKQGIDPAFKQAAQKADKLAKG